MSALDVHVGGHLFEHGIMGMMLEEKRTVVLVTHQLQYLPMAEMVRLLFVGNSNLRVIQKDNLTNIEHFQQFQSHHVKYVYYTRRLKGKDSFELHLTIILNFEILLE